MSYIIKFLENTRNVAGVAFFLFFFMMMGGWADADELLESEFFENSFEEKKDPFDSNSNELKPVDSQPQTSFPSKQEKLRAPQNKMELDRDYFKGIFSDIVYTASSPLIWDRSDWITAGWVAGGTGMFIALDEEIHSTFKDNRGSTTDGLAGIFEPFGNGAFTIPGLAAFYILGHFHEDEKAKRTTLIAMESFLITGLYTTVLKASFGRHRPSTGDSSTSFDGFSIDHNSFPSGHTSTAFAIATVFANQYEKNTLHKTHIIWTRYTDGTFQDQ
ncbi:MAG: phosphatase PAP2 family protein [Nitrospinales bacterium]